MEINRRKIYFQNALHYTPKRYIIMLLQCTSMIARIIKMDWMTTKEAAEQWGLTMRRVQALCEADRVKGAVLLSRIWVIPKGTPKPIDGRTKAAKLDRDKNETN
jgi:hypothetical protein